MGAVIIKAADCGTAMPSRKIENWNMNRKKSRIGF